MSKKDYDEKVLHTEEVGYELGVPVKLSLERSRGPNEPVFIVLTIDGDRHEFELAVELRQLDTTQKP